MEDEMLKDMVVNLSIDANDDATRDYAISLARLFGAHLAGVAFAVEPVPPAILAEGGPPEWFDELTREAEASADAAVARFNEAIRGSGILAQARRLTTSALDSGNLFSSIARRFDVSIIRQNDPDENGPNTL